MKRQIKRIIMTCTTCGRNYTREVKENGPDDFLAMPPMLCKYDGKDIKYDLVWNDEA